MVNIFVRSIKFKMKIYTYFILLFQIHVVVICNDDKCVIVQIITDLSYHHVFVGTAQEIGHLVDNEKKQFSNRKHRLK